MKNDTETRYLKKLAMDTRNLIKELSKNIQELKSRGYVVSIYGDGNHIYETNHVLHNIQPSNTSITKVIAEEL